MISEFDPFKPSLDIPIVKEMRLRYMRKRRLEKMERNQECQNLSCKIKAANSALVRRNLSFSKTLKIASK